MGPPVRRRHNTPVNSPCPATRSVIRMVPGGIHSGPARTSSADRWSAAPVAHRACRSWSASSRSVAPRNADGAGEHAAPTRPESRTAAPSGLCQEWCEWWPADSRPAAGASSFAVPAPAQHRPPGVTSARPLLRAWSTAADLLSDRLQGHRARRHLALRPGRAGRPATPKPPKREASGLGGAPGAGRRRPGPTAVEEPTWRRAGGGGGHAGQP